MKKYLGKILQEPLVHFLILGAFIFGAYHFFTKNKMSHGEIVITQGDIASLRTGFSRTWQREPSEHELEGLISKLVKQDVYCREAMELGLDKDDIIIQRRLQQKMEFIMNDNFEELNPSEVSLKSYFAQHKDNFKEESQFNFRQVFLDSAKRIETFEKDVKKILSDLHVSDEKFQTYSDASMLPAELSNVRESEVAGQFGDAFAKQLLSIQTGKWVGPVKSAFGFHLVFVSKRTDGGTPDLSEVHDDVSREWIDEQRKKANEAYYRELLKKYKVTIEEYK